MIAIPSQPVALTIAGSDSSGGAGIQADLKTFAALGAHGTSAITAVTAQNRRGVAAVEMMSPELVRQQVKTVSEEFSVAAVKTGMLGNRAIIDAAADVLRTMSNLKLIVDPVMVATSGARLLSEDSIQSLKDNLLRQALLITPNLDEAAVLLDVPKAESRAQMEQQALSLAAQTGTAVLVKGGHLNDDATSPRSASDVLARGDQIKWFDAPFVLDSDTHGTGCTLSAAVTACVAKGEDLITAIEHAKAFVTEALIAAQGCVKVPHDKGGSRH